MCFIRYFVLNCFPFKFLNSVHANEINNVAALFSKSKFQAVVNKGIRAFANLLVLEFKRFLNFYCVFYATNEEFLNVLLLE